MARPKAKNIAFDLDLTATAKPKPSKVLVPGCYGDYSESLCGSEPFCGWGTMGQCKRGVALDKRFQVWLIHPESDTESVEVTFDDVQDARQYTRDREPSSDGLGFWDIRDKTGAKVLDLFEEGDEALFFGTPPTPTE